MALSPELKEVLKISRNASYSSDHDKESTHKMFFFLVSRGWSAQNGSSSPSRSRWRLNGKGPWLSVRTAVKRQVDQEYTWGFSKEDIHEIGLEMQRAMEDRWSTDEMHGLVNKLLKLTE